MENNWDLRQLDCKDKGIMYVKIMIFIAVK
jgi:hypothetical protein